MLPRMGELSGILGGRDYTRGVIDASHLLDPQDQVLLEEGHGDYAVYEDLARDDMVWSAMQQRRAATINLPFEVVAGGESARDKAAAEALDDTLRALTAPAADAGVRRVTGFDAACDQMLWCVLYGFSAAEMIWGRDGRHVTIDAIRVRNRKRFRFDGKYRLRLLTTQNTMPGEEMPDKKFWLMQNGADNADEPYGRGLGHQLYWLVLFKRHEMTHWLTASDKFGIPNLLLSHEDDLSPEDELKLEQKIRDWQAGTGILLPEKVKAELMAAGRGGTLDFAAFHAGLDRAIVRTVLSETMTTDDGSSRSQAEVHMEVRKEITAMDALLLAESFAPVSAWLTDWNYPGAATPTVRRVLDPPRDQKEQVLIDKELSGMGFRLSRDYVEARYDVKLDAETPEGDGEPPEALLAGPNGEAVPAANARRGIDRILDAIDSGDLARLPEEELDRILDAARRRPDALLGEMQRIYDGMDFDDLAKRLGRILVVAEAMGMESAAP